MDDATLRTLGIDPRRVERAAVVDGGCSGARLVRLSLWPPARGSSVVKLLAPRVGPFPPRDPLLRELRLHESGLLADLPASVETAVQAWTRTTAALIAAVGDGAETGALLLRDVAPYLLRVPLRPPTGSLPIGVLELLDRLAQMHARFWGDPRLEDRTLGLLPPRDALLLMAPTTVAARIAAGDPSAYLRDASAGWETFLRMARPAAAATLRAVLADPAPILEAIAALPATLCHGDVWGPNLGWIPPEGGVRHAQRRLLLLDWGLATAGPASYDPLWLAATWHPLEPRRVLAVYRARLTQHLAARGIALDPATWRALANAGYLRTLLLCGEALGRRALRAPEGIARRRIERRIAWWADRAAAAAERLCQPAESPITTMRAA